MTLLSDTRYIFQILTETCSKSDSSFLLIVPTYYFPSFVHSTSNLSKFPGILPAGVSYLEFATAGILLQNAFGSALQSGNSIVFDIDSGFLQKMLVTQVRRPAILLGRLASDAFRAVVQSAIILALAYVQGAYVTIGVVGILLIFFTIAFFGLAWSGISLAIGMKTRSSETVFAMCGFITFPLLF